MFMGQYVLVNVNGESLISWTLKTNKYYHDKNLWVQKIIDGWNSVSSDLR